MGADASAHERHDARQEGDLGFEEPHAVCGEQRFGIAADPIGETRFLRTVLTATRACHRFFGASIELSQGNL